jgi:hypothetical protein
MGKDHLGPVDQPGFAETGERDIHHGPGWIDGREAPVRFSGSCRYDLAGPAASPGDEDPGG